MVEVAAQRGHRSPTLPACSRPGSVEAMARSPGRCRLCMHGRHSKAQQGPPSPLSPHHTHKPPPPCPPLPPPHGCKRTGNERQRLGRVRERWDQGHSQHGATRRVGLRCLAHDGSPPAVPAGHSRGRGAGQRRAGEGGHFLCWCAGCCGEGSCTRVRAGGRGGGVWSVECAACPPVAPCPLWWCSIKPRSLLVLPQTRTPGYKKKSCTTRPRRQVSTSCNSNILELHLTRKRAAWIRPGPPSERGLCAHSRGERGRCGRRHGAGGAA